MEEKQAGNLLYSTFVYTPYHFYNQTRLPPKRKHLIQSVHRLQRQQLNARRLTSITFSIGKDHSVNLLCLSRVDAQREHGLQCRIYSPVWFFASFETISGLFRLNCSSVMRGIEPPVQAEARRRLQ